MGVPAQSRERAGWPHGSLPTQTVPVLYEQQGTDLKRTPKRNNLQGDGEKSTQSITAPKASHQPTPHRRHRGGNPAGGANAPLCPTPAPVPGQPTPSAPGRIPTRRRADSSAVPPRSVPPRRAPQGCTAALMPRDNPGRSARRWNALIKRGASSPG